MNGHSADSDLPNWVLNGAERKGRRLFPLGLPATEAVSQSVSLLLLLLLLLPAAAAAAAAACLLLLVAAVAAAAAAAG